MKWYPVELHTHTEHSDGDFTVAGLVHAAKDRGFTAVALTDHNTASGLAELSLIHISPEFVDSPGVNFGSAAAAKFGVPGARPISEEVMIARDIAPVSYTHLDVYKRQMYT